MRFKKQKDIENYVENSISKACKDRDHAYRLVALSNISEDNLPEVRTLALRDFIYDEKLVIFHTDLRSPKIKAIEKNGNVSLLFYDKDSRIQLRFKAKASIYSKDKISEKRWENTKRYCKKTYMNILPQSSESSINTDSKPKNLDSRDITDEEINFAYENFAVISCKFYEVEFLHINHKQHVRAKITFDKNGKNNFCWLIP